MIKKDITLSSILQEVSKHIPKQHYFHCIYLIGLHHLLPLTKSLITQIQIKYQIS